MRFGSHGTSEFVSSSWIRHRNLLTEKDWADAVQRPGTKQDKDSFTLNSSLKKREKKTGPRSLSQRLLGLLLGRGNNIEIL